MVVTLYILCDRLWSWPQQLDPSVHSEVPTVAVVLPGVAIHHVAKPLKLRYARPFELRQASDHLLEVRS